MSRWILGIIAAAAVGGMFGGASIGRPDEPSGKQTQTAAPGPATPAAKAFDKLKQLDGVWQGKSTKGWTDRCVYRTIAGGSVVMETSFDAHPGESMATLHHMDGPDLILTHYCVARNQPRLKATEFSPDGNTITFTFKDATNLVSRDRGHMDKVVIEFDLPDRFTSHWTWYQDGKENWMEKIEHTRIKETPNQDPPAGGVVVAAALAAGKSTDIQGDSIMASPIGYDGGLTCSMQVTNIDRAIKWYGDVLGFKLVYKIDEMGWAEMSTEVNRVNLGLGQVEKITGRGNVKLTFGVKDIDKARAQLESKGVKFDGPTITIEGMVKLATFFDPDENISMFYQDLQKH
jgi:predicted enzyme related to lactoylglutathione lyase